MVGGWVVGGWWWWLRPILVFRLSLDQAEQIPNLSASQTESTLSFEAFYLLKMTISDLPNQNNLTEPTDHILQNITQVT